MFGKHITYDQWPRPQDHFKKKLDGATSDSETLELGGAHKPRRVKGPRGNEKEVERTRAKSRSRSVSAPSVREPEEVETPRTTMPPTSPKATPGEGEESKSDPSQIPNVAVSPDRTEHWQGWRIQNENRLGLLESIQCQELVTNHVGSASKQRRECWQVIMCNKLAFLNLKINQLCLYTYHHHSSFCC